MAEQRTPGQEPHENQVDPQPRPDPTGPAPPPPPPPPPPPQPRPEALLRRSRRDRIIGGVCGGLGRYLGVDPVLFRIAFVLLLLLGGSGFLIYIIAWIIMPEAREYEEAEFVPRGDTGMATTVIGIALVAFGALLLIQRFTPWFDMRVIGGIILVGIGLAIVMRGIRSG